MSYPYKVAIVGDGAPHIASKADYHRQAEMFARQLNEVVVRDGNETVHKFEAVVVDSAEEALNGHLRLINYRRILVFISNRFMASAMKLAKERACSKVVVVTGLPPDDEPVIISKHWLGDVELADLID